MKRIASLLGVAVFGFAALPSLAQAQVIFVQPARVYAQPVFIAPPVVNSYYYAPSIAPPSVTYQQSYSYYGGPANVVYSAPAPIVTYAPPAAYYVPAPGYYETRTYYGYGVFRPRGYYNETYYRP